MKHNCSQAQLLRNNLALKLKIELEEETRLIHPVVKIYLK